MSETLKKVAVKAKPTHPPAIDMVKAAINAANSRKGLSLAMIKKFLVDSHKIDIGKYGPFLRRSITASVEKGILIRMGNSKGASGSFKLAPIAKLEKKTEKSDEKKVAKKTDEVKKVAKKTDEKKKVVKKNDAPAKPKAVKKPVEKKETAKVSKKTEEKKVVKVKKAVPEKKETVKKAEAKVSDKKETESKPVAKRAAPKSKKVVTPKVVKTATKATPKKVAPKKVVKAVKKN